MTCTYTQESVNNNIKWLYIIATHSSAEQYYNTVIVIDYQLQIPLHFGSTAKTEPCEYHFNLLTQSL